jgi:hypothetical protein
MSLQEQRTHEDLESWTCKVANARRFGILNLRSCKVANVWRSGILNLRSLKIANVRRSGISNLRSLGVANVRWSGISNLRSFEVANSWRPEAMNLRNHEIGNLSNSGVCWRSSSEVTTRGDFLNGEIHEPVRSKVKDVVSKKSGFNVWTSGKLVIVWDVKDIRVHIHTRNILWVRGCFRNVKVPSSPYKRAARARVKGFTTFKVWAVFGRLFVSSCVITVLGCVHYSFPRVRGPFPYFRIPPTHLADDVAVGIFVTRSDCG